MNVAEERKPFLQVELDAIRKAEQVARAANAQGRALSRNDVLGGLLDLWEGCWRRKSRRVTKVILLGCFGADISSELIEYDFLAAEDDAFRAKGAGKLLRIAEGNSAGGTASKQNLIPGPHKGGSRRGAGGGAGEEPEEISPAHIPGPSGSSSNQQSADQQLKEERDLERATEPAPEQPPPPDTSAILDVYAHYRETFHRRQPEPTAPERDVIRARLLDGYSPEEQKRAINGLNNSDFHRRRHHSALRYALGDRDTVERCMGWATNAPPPDQELPRSRADPNRPRINQDGAHYVPEGSLCADCNGPAQCEWWGHWLCYPCLAKQKQQEQERQLEQAQALTLADTEPKPLTPREAQRLIDAGDVEPVPWDPKR